MLLTNTQLNLIFNDYLKNYVLLRVANPHPVFRSPKGGMALTKRLYKILRNKDLEHLVIGKQVNFLELLSHLEKFFSEHDHIYVVGLDHAFSLRDCAILRNIYLRKILSNS